MLLMLVMVALCSRAFALSVSFTYPANDAELINPYMGSAVWADDNPAHEQPFTLVYANLRWADFEPEQGQYDFAAFEKENQFELWRAQGKHLILRFVMDLPSSKKHRDIPDWLYEATDGDGKAYHVDYGRGYSPNYANPVLIEAHARAIAAIGERYGGDSFIAFVEIGSLGHWGEWHISGDIGKMPLQSVYDQYVHPYLDAFPNAFLLMRRPFAAAAENGLGLYNDTAGEPNSTGTWLGWISAGGNYSESADGEDALLPMPNAWQAAPIGGELSTKMKQEALLGDLLDQTLSLFEQSHTCWIGPGSFADVQRGGPYQEALDTLNRTIGYRLRVERCDVEEDADGQTQVILYWTNDGIAPFYFPWLPTLSLTDADANVTWLPLDLHPVDILPGQTTVVKAAIPKLDAGKGPYTLRVGIVGPETDKAGVALAMQANQEDNWYELLRLQAP